MKSLLRRIWQKLNEPVKSECRITYRGESDEIEKTAPGRIVARMTCHYSGIAVASEESALFGVIRPFADSQGCKPGSKKETCNIVCNLDFENYTGHDQRCPTCGESFVPEVDFKALKGIFHVTSVSFVPDTVSQNQ